jgi:16S rRNA (guanine(527)-N(7))-methyltransferase RsmG
MFHVKHTAPGDAGITPAIAARLDRFVQLLLRWNPRINLVARGDEAELWHRHILDSAQLAPLLPDPVGDLIDLGSGAGFPGLILALLTEWRVHLVEADHRKAAFLREAIRETGATAIVHAARAEALSIAPGRVVTARALAPLATLLDLAQPLLAPDGICVLPKGRGVEDELTAAAGEWHMRVERFPSRTSPGATILRISEIQRAGPRS